MDDKTYKRMQLGCSCGHVSRSMSEEARHRHNFPALCRKPKAKKPAAKKEARDGRND